MINKYISIALKKLEAHRIDGEDSRLSIEEVASLMDLINFPNSENVNPSIFFNFSYN